MANQTRPSYWRVVKRTVSYYDPEHYRLGLTLVYSGKVVSCATSLSDAVTGSISDQTYVAPGAVSLAVTPTGGSDSILIAGFAVDNDNTPTAVDLVATGDSTLIYQANVAPGNPLHGQLYRPVSGASGSYAVTGEYTPGYGYDNNEYWAGVVAAIQTSATAPVQWAADTHSGQVVVTLDNPPTPGNMLVLTVATRVNSGSWPSDPPGLVPADGWSEPVRATLRGALHSKLELLCRCVAEGDGSEYGAGVGGGGNYSVVVVSEWEIT